MRTVISKQDMAKTVFARLLFVLLVAVQGCSSLPEENPGLKSSTILDEIDISLQQQISQHKPKASHSTH